MDYYFIVIGSVTNAMKIKAYFKQDGDYICVVQTPKAIAQNGCSYSIKAKPSEKNSILSACDRLHIIVRAVYGVDKQQRYIRV